MTDRISQDQPGNFFSQGIKLEEFIKFNADIFTMSPPCQPFTRCVVIHWWKKPLYFWDLFLKLFFGLGKAIKRHQMIQGQKAFCTFWKLYEGGIFTNVIGQKIFENAAENIFILLCHFFSLTKPPSYILMENVKGFEVSQTRYTSHKNSPCELRTVCQGRNNE